MLFGDFVEFPTTFGQHEEMEQFEECSPTKGFLQWYPLIWYSPINDSSLLWLPMFGVLSLLAYWMWAWATSEAGLSDLRLLDFNVAKRLTEGGGDCDEWCFDVLWKSSQRSLKNKVI